MAETIERKYGTGRRKAAIARVWLNAGSGGILINGRTLDDYFPRYRDRATLMLPLVTTEQEGKLDLNITVKGGGQSGQAGAIRHGIARALIRHDEQLRPSLKRAGLLTRDARIKERKKYGQPGARKNYQFSKR